MNKYYWLIAGALVGVFSVITAYSNLQLLLPEGTNGMLSLTGMVIVVLEYMIVIYILDLLRMLKK